MTTIAATVGSALTSAPWGSAAFGLPAGIIAKEIERARTRDLRRRAIDVARSHARDAPDTRLLLRMLQPYFVRHDQSPRMRDLAGITDLGVVESVFSLGRDGYELESQAASAAAGQMTLAEATRAHELMGLEAREPNPAKAAVAESERVAAIGRFRTAI